MSNPVCVADYEELAGSKLDKNAWDYYRSGADQEQTLSDNRQAFKRYRLRPRVLNDVSNVDMTTKVLGSTLSFPVCVAPTAMNKMAHPDGESAVAKAAGAMETSFTFSTWSTTKVETIGKNAPNTIKWLQLYLYKDREVSKKLVQRAEENGFTAIILTVDTPVFGKRYRDVRNKFTLPPHLTLENFLSDNHPDVVGEASSGLAEYATSLLDPSLQWSDIEWLKSITSLPIVLKGIITGEMAELAVKHKVDGIVVSNHGARQLDGVPATIDALSEVVKVVDGRIEVYVDGGIRTGTDVLKAIALGAKTVFVGRPVIWALAHDGENGVIEMLTILKEEFKIAMQLMGCTSIADLQSGNNLVVHESYYKSRL